MKLKLADTNVRMWKNETSKRTKRSFKGLHLSLKTMAREKQDISYPFTLRPNQLYISTFFFESRKLYGYSDSESSHSCLTHHAHLHDSLESSSSIQRNLKDRRTSDQAHWLKRNTYTTNTHLPEGRPPIITGDHEFHLWKIANSSV